MMTSSSVFDLLAELCSPSGVSDLTLSSDGSVSVRRNGSLLVRKLEGLSSSWSRLIRCLELQPGRTATRVSPLGQRFRLLLASHSRGSSLSIRPIAAQIRTPDELLLPVSFVDFFVGLRSGLVLVAGPSGSGKSTSIASLLHARAGRVGGKIVTLEEPIEYLFENSPGCYFEQRELGESVASYADGLKEALHMNPDVILVQEIRDRAAAETALSAALSGHLVVASVHAFSASTAAQRFLGILDPTLADVGARDALASCLEGVLLQRLVAGCDGMVPVFEILLLRDAEGRLRQMERLIRSGSWPALRQEIEMGARQGMMLLEESVRRRKEEGLVP